jgi:hypothetical protein
MADSAEPPPPSPAGILLQVVTLGMRRVVRSRIPELLGLVIVGATIITLAPAWSGVKANTMGGLLAVVGLLVFAVLAFSRRRVGGLISAVSTLVLLFVFAAVALGAAGLIPRLSDGSARRRLHVESGDYTCISDDRELRACRVDEDSAGLRLTFLGPSHGEEGLVDRYTGLLVTTETGYRGTVTNEFTESASVPPQAFSSSLELTVESPTEMRGEWTFPAQSSRSFRMIRKKPS